MPLAPHYPSDEPEDNEPAPDIEGVIDRILNGGTDPSFAVVDA